MPAAPDPNSARDRFARLTVLAGLLACAAGVVAHRLWLDLPISRAAELAAIAALAALPAWALVRWRAMRWPTALLAIWALAALVHVGPVAGLAAIALALAALAVGTLLSEDTATACVAGAGLLAGLLAWSLPWPVHRPYVYLPLVVVLVALRRDALRAHWAGVSARWRAAVDSAPAMATLAMLALGVASTGLWLPTLQHDDLAYHLGLPWQLQLHGRYALDPTHQVWALAPWLGDAWQAMAQVVAGGESRGAVNAGWLAAGAMLLWRIGGQLGLASGARWLILVLFATLPLLPALLAGMQTELPATAATLALATLALEREPRPRALLAVGALLGMLAGLKLIHPVAASALVVAALWRHRTLARREGAGALLLALAIGGSSYVHAWHIAGNPVLPLLNASFQSPYFPPVDFVDARWQGDGLATPWWLTFETSRYLEAWNGGFGFVLVALGGALLVGACLRRTRLLAACAAVALLAPLAVMPYARYAFVGLVLALPVAVYALHRVFDARTASRALLAVAALNFLFVPNAHWLLHTGGAKRALLAAGRDAPLMARYAPERLLHARIRAQRPGAVVLDLHGATHAELAGAGRTATWYAPRLHAQAVAADRDASGGAWAELLARHGITDVILRRDALPPARAAGLARAGADPVLMLHGVEWRRLPAAIAR